MTFDLYFSISPAHSYYSYISIRSAQLLWMDIKFFGIPTPYFSTIFFPFYFIGILYWEKFPTLNLKLISAWIGTIRIYSSGFFSSNSNSFIGFTLIFLICKPLTAILFQLKYLEPLIIKFASFLMVSSYHQLIINHTASTANNPHSIYYYKGCLQGALYFFIYKTYRQSITSGQA